VHGILYNDVSLREQCLRALESIKTNPNHKVLAFALLSAFDLAMNAAAGSAAATVGAHLNSVQVTGTMVRLGALAGLTKAAVSTFREVVLSIRVNFIFYVLLLLLFSSFGVSIVVTAEVCNLAIGESKALSNAQRLHAVNFWQRLLRF
jgi:hypothetical protein